MLVFFLYACFNVAISEPRLFGMFELFRWFRGLILVLGVAFYLRSEREVRLLVFALALQISFEALLALKQRYFEGIHRVSPFLDRQLSGGGRTTVTVHGASATI